MSQIKYLTMFIIVLLTSISNASLSDYHYYPEGFIKNIKNYSNNNILSENLRKILEFDHQKTSAQDIIHSVCPSKTVCYRQQDNGNYKQARKYLFGKIALKKDANGKYYINDKYCKIRYDSSHGVGPNKIPNHSFINCEHTWPQSRFNTNYSKNMQKNDLHHLYAVNSRSNSSRGNILFGEVKGDVVSDNCRESFRGKMVNSSSNITAFEPPDSHKGNVARAIFYFSVRYNNSITKEEEFYLRKWHKLDPVDKEESLRNEVVYGIQLNRNPFIDDPSLVDQIKDF